jgi:hypothetical protein
METLQILVLLHQKDTTFDSNDYLIKFLMREWREMGCSVEVMRGVGQQMGADLIIPHVDLTITPQEYLDFLRAYPNVINRHVVDISKSRISNHLVGRNDNYTGPVIVKTERNYGGLPEQFLFPSSRLRRSKWARFARRIMASVGREGTRGASWRYVQSIPPDAYPVFSSVHDVPKEVFENRNLVVEKFLPEIAEGVYCLRYYYFFGSVGVNLLFRSKERGIVKAETALKVEEVPIPDELYEIREKLGFDYGKFDYVLRDGEVVLFDVNRTPATEALWVWGLRDEIARRLAGGIKSKLATQGKDWIGS